MIVYYIQYFGGRGAESGFDWLGEEAKGREGELQPINLEKYQGQTLEQIEGRIRKLEHEELFVLDVKGAIIAAYKGNESSVAFPAELIHEKNVTVTHGHPKSYAEFGGTFSFADIDNMLKSKWKEHRATASGQGEMNYIMRRTKKSSPKGLRNRINKDYLQLKSDMKEAYEKSYQETIKLHGRNHAMHVARQKQVGVLNAYYKEVFPQYGYEYITRKKEYKYNR